LEDESLENRGALHWSQRSALAPTGIPQFGQAKPLSSFERAAGVCCEYEVSGVSGVSESFGERGRATGSIVIPGFGEVSAGASTNGEKEISD